ncbi:MAG: DUF305 domain-containing protein [Patescibacteria group bacterium]|nr:DUF305 domain-containing protein [Patescibacteria group bacterium]
MMIIMVIVGWYSMTAAISDGRTFNLDKVYAVLLMAAVGTLATMAVMYTPFGKGDRVIAGSLLVLSVWLVFALRRQAFIGRQQFLASMIEHHSMALVMARRVLEKHPDPDLQELARGILSGQACEVKLMKEMRKKQVGVDDVLACRQ